MLDSSCFSSNFGLVMAHMHLGEADLTDLLTSTKKCRSTLFLEKLESKIDWKPFEALLSRVYSKTRGRQSFPPLILFKSLLLQQWYNLSDYSLEDALSDRISFRRFVGISLSESVPDHSVFCRFRDQLRLHDLMEQLNQELTNQLNHKGLILKQGTLVDASIIQSSARSPDQNKDGSAGRSDVDEDARWVRMGFKRAFGYKMHVGVDQGSGFIHSHLLTPANVYEGHVLEPLIHKSEDWVYADKAYDNKSNVHLLRDNHISNGILLHGFSHRKLTETYRACNRILSQVRCGVERIFGTLKRSYGYYRVRYRGLKRNSQQLTLLCMAFNMRKMTMIEA